jgi:hypothetical protein
VLQQVQAFCTHCETSSQPRSSSCALRSSDRQTDNTTRHPRRPVPLLTSALVQKLAEGLQLFLVLDGRLSVLVPQGSPCFFQSCDLEERKVLAFGKGSLKRLPFCLSFGPGYR